MLISKKCNPGEQEIGHNCNIKHVIDFLVNVVQRQNRYSDHNW